MVEIQKVGRNIKLSTEMKYFKHDVRFQMYHTRTFLRMEATGCSQLVQAGSEAPLPLVEATCSGTRTRD